MGNVLSEAKEPEKAEYYNQKAVELSKCDSQYTQSYMNLANTQFALKVFFQ